MIISTVSPVWSWVFSGVGGEFQEFPQEEGQTLGANWSEMGTTAWMTQEAAIRDNSSLPSSGVPSSSDLMSSPLRKRIRSPDLREALSAGLPGDKREGAVSRAGPVSPARTGAGAEQGHIRAGRAHARPSALGSQPL